MASQREQEYYALSLCEWGSHTPLDREWAPRRARAGPSPLWLKPPGRRARPLAYAQLGLAEPSGVDCRVALRNQTELSRSRHIRARSRLTCCSRSGLGRTGHMKLDISKLPLPHSDPSGTCPYRSIFHSLILTHPAHAHTDRSSSFEWAGPRHTRPLETPTRGDSGHDSG